MTIENSDLNNGHASNRQARCILRINTGVPIIDQVMLFLFLFLEQFQNSKSFWQLLSTWMQTNCFITIPTLVASASFWPCCCRSAGAASTGSSLWPDSGTCPTQQILYIIKLMIILYSRQVIEPSPYDHALTSSNLRHLWRSNWHFFIAGWLSRQSGKELSVDLLAKLTKDPTCHI